MKPEVFWTKVNRSAGPEFCWPWDGARNRAGYGLLKYESRTFRAHRVAWLLTHGRLPEPPFQLDHLCRVRHCVNPAHLEVVTSLENTRRGVVARGGPVTHCPRGHEYTPANTKVSKRNQRMCRACNRIWMRNHRSSSTALESVDGAVPRARLGTPTGSTAAADIR